MSGFSFTLQEDFWENLVLGEDDIENLYNYLLETETPRSSEDLAEILIRDRITAEKKAIEKRRSDGGDIYYPKKEYEVGASIVFPSQGWGKGTVVGKRKGFNPDIETLDVISVEFEDGRTVDYASHLEEHLMNNPPKIQDEDGLLDTKNVLAEYGAAIAETVGETLRNNEEFVEIAGRWFPKALLVEINVGHLNLTEAILEMEGGGPLPTVQLLDTLDFSEDTNRSLLTFSMDYALWKDERFDEVGPAGKILWFLRRLEPKDALETPMTLRYFPTAATIGAARLGSNSAGTPRSLRGVWPK